MRLAWCLSLSVLLFACNPSEDSVPAFIDSSSVDLVTTVSQGSNSHGISELWMYVDGNVLGVLDTPVSLPVLEEGNHTLSFYAGIKNNGMGTSRIRYPFYAGFDTTLNLRSGEHYTVNPTFRYTTDALVDATRNFEAGNSFVEVSSNQGQIELLNNPDLASGGVRCVRMKLPADAGILSYVDESNITLSSGEIGFLEMDYSCNNTFIVGLYVVSNGDSEKVPVLYLTPTNEGDGSQPTWNKVYMDLGMMAAQYPSTDYFRLYIECTRSEALIPTIYLDDLKIVK
ncbi:MAG: hypothetical protein ACK478_11805 [Flavobacteriales bacterium]|jgi:hypothetical protein